MLSRANAILWAELRITPTHEGLRLYFPPDRVCWVYVEGLWLPGIPLNLTTPYEPTKSDELIKPYEPNRCLQPGIIFTCVRADGETIGKNVPYVKFGEWVSVSSVKPNTRPDFAMPRVLNLCTPHGVLPNLLDKEGFYSGSNTQYRPPDSYIVVKLPAALAVGSRISVEEYIVNIPRPTQVPYDVGGKTDEKLDGKLMKSCQVHRKTSNLAKFMNRKGLQCFWSWEWDCGCQWMDPQR